MKKILLLFSLLFLFACSDRGKICTEEFRMISVEITDTVNEPIEIDNYYLIKVESGDTVFTKDNPAVGNDISGELIIFTDNQMAYTDEEGKEFRLNCYKDQTNIVQENYQIRHDGCHVELVSGKTRIRLDN
jgi:hypothetical protein